MILMIKSNLMIYGKFVIVLLKNIKIRKRESNKKHLIK